jgi:hypothetical protein
VNIEFLARNKCAFMLRDILQHMPLTNSFSAASVRTDNFLPRLVANNPPKFSKNATKRFFQGERSLLKSEAL